MKIDLTNISQINAYQDELNMRIDELAHHAAEVYYDEVRKITPVRTGRLKAGYEVEGSEVSNDVYYLPYVNDGTWKQAGQHFIERALTATARRLK